ncbi:MAG: RNA 2'-phosphotransferase [bacterium]|nr:RNA 2'-phosphotransferase [bacterium]
MTNTELQKSKLLSLVLRHNPQEIGIDLDDAGWASVKQLLKELARTGKPMTMTELEYLVAKSDKQRFVFSLDKKSIRANQGHSVKVNLGLVSTEPPPILYHGTVERFLESIWRQGLLPGKRHQVHLHEEFALARTVGSRRGAPHVLVIDAKTMWDDNFSFFVSANSVWLTGTVPPKYLKSYADNRPKSTGGRV